MGVEIERKFLVGDESWRGAARGEPEHYRQGYLALTERASVRVRLGGDGSAWLGIKERRVGPVRAEFEYAIPADDAERLLELAAGCVIEKQRFRVAHGGLEWEVDEFLGANAGLVVAEIELEHEDSPFERPPWLGREVTAEAAYYNAALALHPWREWGGSRTE